MPALATPAHPRPSTLTSSLSSGVSETSQELTERTRTFLGRFYGVSALLHRVYPSSPIVIDTVGTVESFIRETVKDSMSRLDALRTWPEGWDGYDSAPVDPSAVEHAKQWIEQMFRAAMTVSAMWKDPNITGSSDGEVVFEWWRGNKKLTVYLTAETAEYVQVWGLDIANEMADGSADSLSDRQTLWLWLTA